MKKPILAVLVLLLLTSLACSFSVNLPNVKVKTGPTETLTVSETASSSAPQSVEINMGAGSLNLTGGATGLLDGTVRYNVAGWKPVLAHSGDQLTLKQEHTDSVSIPSEVVNEWNLKLGGSAPIDLSIAAGAYQGDINLTGLGLRSLKITDGAANTSVRFDAQNPETMERFEYKTGASQVKLSGLGFANFKELTFESGAGNYTLDFSGVLKQNANVSIKSGVSQISIIIPRGTSARVTNSGALTNVETRGTWTAGSDGKVYSTGSGTPTLNIDVTGGVGNLTLTVE